MTAKKNRAPGGNFLLPRDRRHGCLCAGVILPRSQRRVGSTNASATREYPSCFSSCRFMKSCWRGLEDESHPAAKGSTTTADTAIQRIILAVMWFPPPRLALGLSCRKLPDTMCVSTRDSAEKRTIELAFSSPYSAFRSGSKRVAVLLAFYIRSRPRASYYAENIKVDVRSYFEAPPERPRTTRVTSSPDGVVAAVS